MQSADTIVKSVSEVRTDDQGRSVRVTRKIRMKLVTEMVEPEVAARRAWRKFGIAANDGPGPNVSSTISGEPVFLKLAMDADFDKQEAAATQVSVGEAKSVKCRFCEGPHWSAKCPYKETFAGTAPKLNSASGTATSTDAAGSETAIPNEASSAPAKYVPKFRRSAIGDEANKSSFDATDPSGTTDDRDQGLAIRISNLSDVAVEADIRELCTRIGANVARCNVARDRFSGRCKGYAFVNFYTREDAEQVMNRLNGLPYGNLILKAEIARPSEK